MSNESGIGLQYPVLVVGGDGSTLWAGIGVISDIQRGVNSDTATISAGNAVGIDGANTYVQPWDQASTTAPIKQYLSVRNAITTGTYDSFAGVALIKAAVGENVIIAGGGSVVAVKSTAAGTLQYNCIGSTTAGSITPQSALATAPHGTLGKVVKIAGTTGGTTDSGSASYVICAVNIS